MTNQSHEVVGLHHRFRVLEKDGVPVDYNEPPFTIYLNSDFPKDPEIKKNVGRIAADPEFIKRHPNQRVFVLPDGQILGSLPLEERSVETATEGIFDRSLVASRALQEEAQRRGTDLHSCAIITTGQPKATYYIE